MATAENRDLTGLGYPVTADPMTCDGQQWIEANFAPAKRWTQPAGASEFDPDPPGAPIPRLEVILAKRDPGEQATSSPGPG